MQPELVVTTVKDDNGGVRLVLSEEPLPIEGSLKEGEVVERRAPLWMLLGLPSPGQITLML